VGTLASNAYFNVCAAGEDTPRMGVVRRNPFDMRIHRGANEIGGKCVELRRGPDMGSKRS
jgi:hypothetical protein